MTARARLVLGDAKAALARHKGVVMGPEFRASWFAVVGLLRAVGHVLLKVDASTDPKLASAVETCWAELNRSKPDPVIFWGFIDSERNRFLKNYEHGITRVRIFRTSSPHNVLALDLANAEKGVQLLSVRVPDDVQDRSIVSVLSDGPFAGTPEIEVATRAIDWWEQYLARIEMLCAISLQQ
jgi:hypothetical protein